jgi:hypothetical protein
VQKNYPPSIADFAAASGFMEYQLAALTITTDLAETVIGQMASAGAAIALGAVSLAPAVALAANNTNNVTITINKRTAAAPTVAVPIAVGTTAVSGTNSTGSWVQWSQVQLTVVSGAFLSPGDVITIAVTHASAGIAVPQSLITFFPTLN